MKENVVNKLSYDYVKNEIEKAGYFLLSKEYENNKIDLKCLCKNNHVFFIKWIKWNRNEEKCPFCRNIEKKYKRKKAFYDKIKSNFEKEGYKLLTSIDEFEGNNTKLRYICPNGHEYFITWISWKRGCRCYICNGNIKHDYEYIKSGFEKEGYELLSKTYENNKEKLKYRCNNNHIGYISWNSWISGSRCKFCYDEKRNLINKHDYEYIKSEFEKEGYELLSKTYDNAFSYLKYKCPIGHINKIIWNSWQQGTRCPSCSHIESKAENEIYFFLKSVYNGDILKRDRNIISPFELDIVIPDKKTAIEYCGLYWHSETNINDKNYHLNKLDLCNKAGYRLITIFEDEWLFKRDIVEKRILYNINLNNSKKLFARKCEVKEISNKVKSDFLNKFHIQGDDFSSIRLGLFYNENLVSVMTFRKLNISKGHNPNLKYCFELSRFCSDYEYIIVGSASKLFNYFLKNYNFDKIISFADRRWSNGNLYNILNFKFVHNTKPNYWYFNKSECKRYHRFNFRKDRLSKILEKFDPNLTEYENMIENNYHRIWDCGNILFEYERDINE